MVGSFKFEREEIELSLKHDVNIYIKGYSPLGNTIDILLTSLYKFFKFLNDDLQL